MKYDYSVIYNGVFYRAGEEVPVVTDEKTSDNNSDENSEEKVPEIPEIHENINTDGEKAEDNNTNSEVEPKKSNRKRTKA